MQIRNTIFIAILLLFLFGSFSVLLNLAHRNATSRSERVARQVKAIGGLCRKDSEGNIVAIELRGVSDHTCLDFLQLVREDLEILALRHIQIQKIETLRKIGVLPHLVDMRLDDGFCNVALPVQQFPSLCCLHLSALTFPESFFDSFSDMQLKKLEIFGSSISDDCVRSIGKLTSLEYIELSRNKCLSDRGVAYLGALPRLRILYLHELNISGSAFSAFTKDSPLEFLDVVKSHFDSTGCKYVSKLDGLCAINALGTDVTDVGVSRLSALTELQTLCVPSSAITENCVSDLEAMPNLRFLVVWRGPLANANWFHNWSKKTSDSGTTILRRELTDNGT